MRGLPSTIAECHTRHLVDAAGALCTLGYATLACLARDAGEPGLPAFFGIVAWTAMPVFALYLHAVRRDEPIPVARLLFWALAFRLCGLIGGPIYEDDFFRYLWDGYRFATAGTPYGVSPEAFFLDQTVPSALRTALDQVNHPELPTIYGPTAQALFLLGYFIQPGSVAVLQALLIAVDLAAVGLLLRLAPARNVLLYAWCPLVIKEIAFTAHPDGLGVCLLLAAIVLATRNRERWAAVCLGLAVGAKIFALILVPLVLIRARLTGWCCFVGTLAVLYAPFAVMGATEFESLAVFAREWEFNSALFGLLTVLLSSTQAKVTLGIACGTLWIWYCRRLRRESLQPGELSQPLRRKEVPAFSSSPAAYFYGSAAVPRGDWVYGVFLVAAPVINAWYLLWLLPFAAVYPSRWAWTASVAVLLSYVTGLNLGDYGMPAYGHPWWVRPLEFGVIGLALLWDLLRNQPAGREAD